MIVKFKVQNIFLCVDSQEAWRLHFKLNVSLRKIPPPPSSPSNPQLSDLRYNSYMYAVLRIHLKSFSGYKNQERICVDIQESYI